MATNWSNFMQTGFHKTHIFQTIVKLTCMECCNISTKHGCLTPCFIIFSISSVFTLLFFNTFTFVHVSTTHNICFCQFSYKLTIAVEHRLPLVAVSVTSTVYTLHAGILNEQTVNKLSRYILLQNIQQF